MTPWNSPWNSPGQNTGLGSHSFLQEIFPTQGLNLCLPHCRWILYQLSHKGSSQLWSITQTWERSNNLEHHMGSTGMVGEGNGREGNRSSLKCQARQTYSREDKKLCCGNKHSTNRSDLKQWGLFLVILHIQWGWPVLSFLILSTKMQADRAPITCTRSSNDLYSTSLS